MQKMTQKRIYEEIKNYKIGNHLYIFCGFEVQLYF